MRLLIFLFLLLSYPAFSQVTVDPTFNPTDVGFGDYSGVRGASISSSINNVYVYTQAIQSDGKILFAGDGIYGYNSYTTGGVINLMRLNSDGSRDVTFNIGSGPSDMVQAIAIQSDGKILIGGKFTSYNGIPVNRICRINVNGTFDPTFNPGLGVSGYSNFTFVNGINIQSDGKILISGNFTAYNSIPASHLARLNTTGSFDATFNSGGTGINNDNALTSIYAVAIQTDGKILISADIINTYNGVNVKHVFRLNNDGSLDATFNLTNILVGTGRVLSLRSDGKVMVGGSFVLGSQVFSGVILLTSTGTYDPSFNSSIGNNSSGGIFSILPVANNKFMVAGSFTLYNGTTIQGLVRINMDGSLDPSFNFLAQTTSFSIYNIQQSMDGGFIYSGNFDNSASLNNNNIDKLTSFYNIDSLFNPVTGAKGVINTFAVQTNGKILIGGSFGSFNNVSRNKIARISADGEIDNTYNPGAGANGNVNSIAIQTDNKIILGGSFTSFNGIATGKIIRTKDTGAIDATFISNIGTGANGNINVVTLQADGKIIIGGNFTFFNGNAANYLARLNSDGTFDNTFNIGSGGFAQVRDIEIQPDGKILIGGDFQFFNSSTIGRIARLNTDGSIDNTFAPASTGANGPVYDIQLAPNGSIFVCGEFTSYNGQSNTRTIVKLTSTGVVDNTFVSNVGSSNGHNIYRIKLYNNNKLLVATSYYSITTTINNPSNLLRLNTNGLIDNTFGLSVGGSGVINSIALLGSGNKLLVAGSFTSIYTGSSIGRNRIARLIDGTVVPLTLNSLKGNLQNSNALISWNTANEINTASFTVERSINNIDFIATGSVIAKGNTINSYSFTDFGIVNLNTNILYYRLKIDDKDGSFTYSSIVSIKLNSKINISLFPNPVKNTVWLQLENTIATEKIQIKLTDILGKQMLLQNNTINSGSTSLPINVAGLPAGIYYIQVISNYRNETIKLIKE